MGDRVRSRNTSPTASPRTSSPRSAASAPSSSSRGIHPSSTKAVALDLEFAAAHAYLAYTFWVSILVGYVEDKTRDAALVRASSERAITLDRNDPIAHLALGRVHIETGEIEQAIAEMKTAISINPNFAWGHFSLGFAYHYGAGRAEEALPHLNAALRLGPRDPWHWRELMIKGMALRHLGRHEDALASCRLACQFPNRGFLPQLHLAAALAEAGNREEVALALAKAPEIQPALSLGYLREQFSSMNGAKRGRASPRAAKGRPGGVSGMVLVFATSWTPPSQKIGCPRNRGKPSSSHFGSSG